MGAATLDKAVTVKMTRTLAIIPITIALALFRAKKSKNGASGKVSIKKIFPFFILFFVAASVITTVSVSLGAPESFFEPFKEISKFLIVMAMAAIGMNTNVVKLVKSGGKPILLGFLCWVSITAVSLALQYAMNLM